MSQLYSSCIFLYGMLERTFNSERGPIALVMGEKRKELTSLSVLSLQIVDQGMAMLTLIGLLTPQSVSSNFDISLCTCAIKDRNPLIKP